MPSSDDGRPALIGLETGAALCSRLDPEAGLTFVTLANDHRPVPVSVWADGAWTTPQDFCADSGCEQPWPCATRNALDIVERLVAHDRPDAF